MTEHPTPIRWNALGRYFSERTEYADKARELITQELGFEPHLMASQYDEILIRNALELYENGKMSKERLDKYIASFSKITRKRILRSIPEQAHLIDKTSIEYTLLKIIRFLFLYLFYFYLNHHFPKYHGHILWYLPLNYIMLTLSLRLREAQWVDKHLLFLTEVFYQ